MAGRSVELCVCGHERDAHEHYRRGTDCAVCGNGDCPRYRKKRDFTWDRVRQWLHIARN
jgi:hypothetical protein